MEFLNDFIPHSIMSSIGWTIINSLWQGLVILLLYFSISLLIPEKKIKVKYALSVSALFLLAFTTIFTFRYEIENYSKKDFVEISSKNEKPVDILDTFKQQLNNENTEIAGVISNSDQQNLFLSFTNLLNSNLNIVVLVWLLGILIISFKYINTLLFTKRLRTSGLQDVPEYWKDRLDTLCNNLSIDKKIKFAQSEIINVPAIVGYFKPIILLPVGTLTGLTPDQVETILVHELTHLARADYLINHIQSFIEVILFFNPAVWLLSSRIREQREIVCDDLTVNYCGNAITYANALTIIGEHSVNNAGFALTAVTKKNQLLRRIQRMLLKDEKSYKKNKFAGISILATILITASLFVLGGSTSAPKNNINTGLNLSSIVPAELPVLISKPDSVEEDQVTIKFTDDGTRWKLVLYDDDIQEIYKDGEELTGDEFDEAYKRFDDNLDDLDERFDDVSIHLDGFNLDMKAFAETMKDFGESFKDFKIDFKFDFDSEEFEEVMEDLGENLSNLTIDLKVDLDGLKTELNNIKIKFDNDDFKESMKDLKESLKDLKVTMPDFDESFKDFHIEMDGLKESMKELKVEMKKLKNFMKETREELVDDGLIDDEDDDFKFYLSQDKMKVNRKKVSDELKEKYLKLYKKHYGKELDDDFTIHNR